MKRFLLFAGEAFYPGGGWNDLKGEFDTLEEAKTKADQFMRENIDNPNDAWFHVVDSESKQIVLEDRRALDGEGTFQEIERER